MVKSMPYLAFYQISMKSKKYQAKVFVKLIGLKVQDTSVLESVQVQHYTILMANSLLDALKKDKYK